MSETVSFVGVIEGMRTSEVTHSTQITTDFIDLESGSKKRLMSYVSLNSKRLQTP